MEISKRKFKKALEEASWWDLQLTEYERTKIVQEKARKKVLKRIFEKYEMK